MRRDEKVPCPYCGEMINKNAQVCLFCGSDEQTGWSDQTYLDGIDIDIENTTTNKNSTKDFYDELVKNEFGKKNNFLPSGKLWKVVTGFLLIILFLLFIIRTLF